jgi:hypothetical protein
MKTLILIIVGIVAVALGYTLGKNKNNRRGGCVDGRGGCCDHSPKMANDKREMGGETKPDGQDGLEAFRDEQAEEKKKNLEQVLGLIEKQGKVTNNDVEKMLGIPESTVTRYFDELEKEGKVRQVGKTGQNVFYTKM